MSTVSTACFGKVGSPGHLLGMFAYLREGWGPVTVKHPRHLFSDSQSIVDYPGVMHCLQGYLELAGLQPCPPHFVAATLHLAIA